MNRVITYKKPEATDIRGMCVKCGEYPQTTKGKGKYRPLCYRCHTARHNMPIRRGKALKRNTVYAHFKKDTCEFCGFIAKHSCQLDVDHKDGDYTNNSPDNLQTLCANCHRLKTYNDKNKEP